ncbi:hypothetical protein [Streptomyces marincola]|uniref:Uncharacterized protein n=1 Tax=Streptomyces marincola TaxID=2878388 RepID=A0A1W7D2N9_9ACTN|nr:hypothetical protein [Streptomyces marincola]ARQ71274.1 hypothetical protein CAG99_22770 [Streptomyces marincola]
MGISAPGMRAVRAAMFAALCVTLSAGAHVVLSGAPVPAPAALVVAVAVFGCAWLLFGAGERRFGAIAALLVPLHLAADTVFTAGQASCYGPAGGPVTGPLRLLGVDLLCAGDFGAPLAHLAAAGREPLAAGGPAGPWLLLAAHIGAALLAACWLRGGERALARVLRAAAAAGFRPLLLARAARARRTAGDARVTRHRPWAAPAAPARQPSLRSVLRRGPPGPAPAL